jgi:hypothetical protein
MPELNPNKWRFKKINIYYKTGTNASKVILPVEETLISFCRAEERNGTLSVEPGFIFR